MYRLTLMFGTFNGRRDEALNLAALRDVGNALARHNLRLLEAYPSLPPLYQSGVQYYHEPGLDDDWQDALVTYQKRAGDCDDLACWRVGELWRRGIAASVDASVRYVWVEEGGEQKEKQRYHIFVRLPNGQAEDPSAILAPAMPVSYPSAHDGIVVPYPVANSNYYAVPYPTAAGW